MPMIQDATARTVSVARRSLRISAAVALLAGASTLSLHAQQSGNPAEAPAASSNLFTAALTPTIDLANLSYSSSVGAGESSSAENFIPSPSDASASDATQPPPRRRYGRPRYNDSSHNADGSNKYGFLAGGGLNFPTNDFNTYNNLGYALQVGGGRNFSNKFGVMLQFDYNHFGLKSSTLQNQSNLYFGTPTGQGLDGSSHIWSFTLNPRYTFYDGNSMGAYVVGGVGFYHKVTNFTLPQSGTICTYYGCFQVTQNANVDSYVSNAAGFSGGGGLTYKLSKFASERVFVEARYVYMANQARTGVTTAAQAATYPGYNYYPENTVKSGYIPITVGLRF